MLPEQSIDYPADPDAGDIDAVFDCLVARLESSNPFLDAVERLAGLDREEARRFAERSLIYAGLIAQNLAEQGPGASFELAFRSLTAELAIAARVSDRTMQARLSEALTLVDDFPLTLHALQCAELSIAHARVVMTAGSSISDPARRADYESSVIARAASVTPGRLRRLAQLAAEKVAGVGFAERHAKAKEGRSVRSFETVDGMSEVVATVPTVLAAGIMDRLTAMANAVRLANPDDPRTLDQLRADLFCELQLTGEATGDVHSGVTGIRAEVAIVIPALTLLGKGDEPATILGGGPIGLDDALQLTAEAPSFLRVITDPVTDLVLATDNYRPSERLRRHLRMRDGRCRCPSCNRAAWRSDIDHTIPFSEGGPTEVGNLEVLCQGHHTIKHLSGWGLRQVSPGVLEWTTPHGIVVVDRPDTPVRFSD
ncbi:MAG TPA: DUF222 domain-containing protein [Terrimesophilobacter sp.]|uniref:HNH endonuclease signature motif containing protein n=1 Tax=Terrimesophilobacter sp. TaxID=2906435 RepID=UPI002F938550